MARWPTRNDESTSIVQSLSKEAEGKATNMVSLLNEEVLVMLESRSYFIIFGEQRYLCRTGDNHSQFNMHASRLIF